MGKLSEGRDESSDDESNTSDKSLSSKVEAGLQTDGGKREKFKKSLKLTSEEIVSKLRPWFLPFLITISSKAGIESAG